MHLDPDRCRHAVATRDRSLDGQFVSSVVTTGVYCRPSCPGGPRARPENLRFHATVDDARAAGFRACKRCRPDEVTGPAAPRGSAPA